jgi:glycosyltransferase involved in cell wall biosynthesis
MNTKTVSIITVTQLSRSDCVKNLSHLIKLQTYENIIEWVIVEGSQTENDGIQNSGKIKDISKEFQLHTPINIVYLGYTGEPLSDLRNNGNIICKGDIIVCMDDDDYYPRERVEDAVYKLENSSCLIAGCSDIYMYDYYLNILYKCRKIHKNHSTNNCMAFKREYLMTNSHEPGLTKSEEKSFTKGFTENMVQLNSKKCIVVSSHNMNTVDKRQLCINEDLFKKTRISVTDLIPLENFEEMKRIFSM